MAQGDARIPASFVAVRQTPQERPSRMAQALDIGAKFGGIFGPTFEAAQGIGAFAQGTLERAKAVAVGIDEALFRAPSALTEQLGGEFPRPESQALEFGARGAGFLFGGPVKLAGKAAARVGAGIAGRVGPRAAGKVGRAAQRSFVGATELGSTAVFHPNDLPTALVLGAAFPIALPVAAGAVMLPFRAIRRAVATSPIGRLIEQKAKEARGVPRRREAMRIKRLRAEERAAKEEERLAEVFEGNDEVARRHYEAQLSALAENAQAQGQALSAGTRIQIRHLQMIMPAFLRRKSREFSDELRRIVATTTPEDRFVSAPGAASIIDDTINNRLAAGGALGPGDTALRQLTAGEQAARDLAAELRGITADNGRITVQRLVQHIQNFRAQIGRSARAGTRRYTPDEQFADNMARELSQGLLEVPFPELIDLNARWAAHSRLMDQAVKKLNIFKGEFETSSAQQFLAEHATRLRTGTGKKLFTEDDIAFLAKFEREVGIDLVERVGAVGEALTRSQTLSRAIKKELTEQLRLVVKRRDAAIGALRKEAQARYRLLQKRFEQWLASPEGRASDFWDIPARFVLTVPRRLLTEGFPPASRLIPSMGLLTLRGLLLAAERVLVVGRAGRQVVGRQIARRRQPPRPERAFPPRRLVAAGVAAFGGSQTAPPPPPSRIPPSFQPLP